MNQDLPADGFDGMLPHESREAVLERQLMLKDAEIAKLRDDLASAQLNAMADARARDFADMLIKVDTPEDIEPKGDEVLIWDGCGYDIDFVEVDADTGAYYMANGTEPESYYPLKEPSNER